MNTELNTTGLLCAAQLLVLAANLLSERLLVSVAGSGSTLDILVNVSANAVRTRISNMVSDFAEADIIDV